MNADDGTVRGDADGASGATRTDGGPARTSGDAGGDGAPSGHATGAGADRTEGWSALASALVGGLATLLLGFVPLSPVLGGAIAGYLRRGSRRTGLKIGAAAGLVAAIPSFVGLVVLSLFVVAGPGGSSAVRFVLLVLLGMTVISVYVVGLSIAGGYLGVVVRERQRAGEAHDPAGGAHDVAGDGWDRTDGRAP